jgi:hypothetical protein
MIMMLFCYLRPSMDTLCTSLLSRSVLIRSFYLDYHYSIWWTSFNSWTSTASQRLHNVTDRSLSGFEALSLCKLDAARDHFDFRNEFQIRLWARHIVSKFIQNELHQSFFHTPKSRTSMTTSEAAPLDEKMVHQAEEHAPDPSNRTPVAAKGARCCHSK